jgi:hypothetical protein
VARVTAAEGVNILRNDLRVEMVRAVTQIDG